MEGVVLVANRALLTVELKEVSRNGTVEGGHGVVVTRGHCDVRVGDAVGGAGVKCNMMVQSGRSVDQERLGGRRDGQEGRTVAAVGGIILRSVGVDVPVRHRCLVDHEGVIVLGLLGTANVRIFVRGAIIDRVVVVVPSRLPRRKSQRAEGGTWTEGRLAVEGGELGNGVRRCRSGPGVSRGIGIGGPSWCCRGVRRWTVCCRRARPPTRTSATEARPGGGGQAAVPIVKPTAPLPGPALGRHRDGPRCRDGCRATEFSC